jgi:hypothetical protein
METSRIQRLKIAWDPDAKKEGRETPPFSLFR